MLTGGFDMQTADGAEHGLVVVRTVVVVVVVKSK